MLDTDTALYDRRGAKAQWGQTTFSESQSYQAEEATGESKQCTSEPVLLTSTTPPVGYLWLRNHTPPKMGSGKLQADAGGIGLSKANVGWYMGIENELLRSMGPFHSVPITHLGFFT